MRGQLWGFSTENTLANNTRRPALERRPAANRIPCLKLMKSQILRNKQRYKLYLPVAKKAEPSWVASLLHGRVCTRQLNLIATKDQELMTQSDNLCNWNRYGKLLAQCNYRPRPIPVMVVGRVRLTPERLQSKVVLLVSETPSWYTEPEQNRSEQVNEPGSVGRGISIPINPWPYNSRSIAGCNLNRGDKAGNEIVKSEIPAPKVSHGRRSQGTPHSPFRTGVLKAKVKWWLWALWPDHHRPRLVNAHVRW